MSVILQLNENWGGVERGTAALIENAEVRVPTGIVTLFVLTEN
jgi:hypothetical protein